MNQIIFDNNSDKTTFRKRIFSSTFFRRKFLLVVIIVVIIGIAGFVIFYKNKNTSNQKDSVYSAVFLSNGQVYFGKIDAVKNNYLILSDIYYIQSVPGGQPSGQGNGTSGNVSLVKLGNELHGPTDKMFINSASVLFYENLRTDSKVVQSIQSSK